MSYFQKFIQKIKNFSFLKKKIFVLVLFTFGFLFFPLLTNAFVFGPVVNAITFLPTLLFALALALGIRLSGAVAQIAGALLDWISGPNFISYSFTNPGGQNPNPVIASGLNITQSLVNMFLVAALIYIALSIALRLAGETEAKKMLARLIFIALIVNFSPVICGLIVDASNITMNYFLVGIQEGISGILGESIEFGRTLAGEAFDFEGSWKDKIRLLVMGAVQISVNFTLALSFFLFSAIFFARYLAIWILVILSPLAFVAWILPATKKMIWNLWWNNFLQWSIIGIPMAFFLYLGMRIFGDLKRAVLGKIDFPGVDPEVATYMDSVIPFLTVLAFLYVGFIMGLKTSALGANTVISLTEKGLRGARRLTGTALRKTGIWGLQRLTKGEGLEWASKQSAIKPSEVFGKSRAGRIIAGAGWAIVLTPAAWGARRLLGEAALRLTEAEINDIKKAEEKYKGTTAQRKLAALRDPRIFMRERVGVLIQAIEEGQNRALRNLGLDDKEIISIGTTALRIHPELFEKIRDAFPHLAEEMGEGFAESIQKLAKVNPQEALAKGYSGVMERIIAEINKVDVSKMDSSILFGPQKNSAALESAIKHWQADQWSEAGKAFGKEFSDEIGKEFQKNPQNFTSSARKYFTSSPARQSL